MPEMWGHEKFREKGLMSAAGVEKKKLVFGAAPFFGRMG
jgi:hypothetical protein